MRLFATYQKPESKIQVPYRAYSTYRSKDFFVGLSGDDAATAVGQFGVSIALIWKAASGLLDYTLVSSRLRAVRLNNSLKVNRNKLTTWTLLVISVCALTVSNNANIKDQFYAAWNRLLHLRATFGIKC